MFASKFTIPLLAALVFVIRYTSNWDLYYEDSHDIETYDIPYQAILSF